MDKNKLKIGRIKPLADDGLKPMEYKENYESRPDIPYNQKITQDDWNSVVYNILDIDKRLQSLDKLWESTEGEINMIYQGLNILYGNIKWNKIYDGQYFTQLPDEYVYATNFTGAPPTNATLFGWTIDQATFNKILDNKANGYIMFVFEDGNNVIHTPMFKNNLSLYKWEPTTDDTNATIGNQGSLDLYVNIDQLIGLDNNYKHVTYIDRNYVSTTIKYQINSTTLGNGLPSNGYMAKITWQNQNKFVFAPFTRKDWTLEGIYGRRADPLSDSSTNALAYLMESQMLNNPNSPYKDNWDKTEEQDDPKIQEIINKGKANSDFRFSLFTANKSAPYIYFVNDKTSGNYYLRIEKSIGNIERIDITCSNPSAFWNTALPKPSKFFKGLFIDNLSYKWKLTSSKNFLNEWSTLLFSLFTNLETTTTPIFINTIAIDYLPNIAIF